MKASEIQIGQRFGRLQVLERCRTDQGARWKCVCECGKEVLVPGPSLVRGTTKSCGCLQTERLRENMGQLWSGNRAEQRILRLALQSAMTRCHNPEAKGYPMYGGKGVKVCQEWRDYPESFYRWARSAGFARGKKLCRKDLFGDFCPENCYWGDKVQKPVSRRAVDPNYDMKDPENRRHPYLEGRTFGKLYVEGNKRDRGRKLGWVCRCECGKVILSAALPLMDGLLTSCGCELGDALPEARRTAIRKEWETMCELCEKNVDKLPGLTLWEDWKDFDRFRAWAEESGFELHYHLRRERFGEGYSPDNCFWTPL